MKVRDKLIRLAGYDPEVLGQHSREDYQSIIHLGWVVLIGATVAGANWTVGGYVFAETSNSAVALVTALIAGAVGISLIVIVDRTALYSIDTHQGRRLSKWSLVLYRAGLTCAVSSITAQAVAPILFKPELELKSLELREEAERDRRQELTARFDIVGLRSAVTSAEAAVRDTRQALLVVPPDIQVRLDVAKACWAEYERRRAYLVHQGWSESEVNREIASSHLTCKRVQAKAENLLEDHRERARTAVSVAEEELRDANRSLKDTSSELAKKVEYAAAIERTAITPLSSNVLSNLLATDSSARQKFWTIFGLIMGIELMPLLTKLMGPQTVPGARIATDRLVTTMLDARRRNLALNERKVEEALSSSMTSTMIEALSSAEVRRFAREFFASKIEALVPVEVFKALMHEVEAREIDVQGLVRRYPSYATLVTEIWRKTIEETVEILRRPRCATPAAGMETPHDVPE
jgi:hypothetical protein